jgi:hypothetical protein
MPFTDQSESAGPSMKPSPQWSGLPNGSPHQHHWMKENPHLHTTDIQEQSLSDYAQQDLSVVTIKITI